MIPVWEIEAMRSKLRGAAYLGHNPVDRLRHRLDVERREVLTPQQVRRVVRLKLRVKESEVSNEDLATLSHMLDFDDRLLVKVDDLVSFVLAEPQALWRSKGSTSSTRATSQSPTSDEASPMTLRPEEVAQLQDVGTRTRAVKPSFEESVLQCCQQHDLTRLQRLLSLQVKPLNQALGCKCVHLAVHLGDADICNLLLRSHVDPMCRARSGATLLLRAALHGHHAIVRNLLWNWRANPMAVDDMGRCALHTACCSDLATLKLLVEHYPVAINIVDALGRNCFYYASTNTDREEQASIVRYLLSHGCDPNALDDEGKPPLWHATESGNAVAASLLLCSGAEAPKVATRALRSPGATQPVKIDWSQAKVENWQFDMSTGPGYSFSKQPEVYKVKAPIQEGISKLKQNPELYLGIMYQSNMVDWEESQQQYKLVERSGSGFQFKKGKGAFTFVQANYRSLKPLDTLGAFQKDDHTDGLSYQGSCCGKLHPGRGQGLCDTPHVKLLGDCHPDDVVQGAVGDCWLLSGLSAMSEFDGAIERLFRSTRTLRELPKDEPEIYKVTVYDLPSWQPVTISVDERLCTKPNGEVLGCAPCVHGELWACYVEKALAIHCGGWDQLDGGEPTHAWRLLTGCKQQYTFRNDGSGFRCFGSFNPNTQNWDPLQNSAAPGSLWPMKWPKLGGGGDLDFRCSKEKMFQKMCAWDSSDYMMALASDKTRRLHNGIIDHHAYTLLSCLSNVANSGQDLVKVRNPHGHGECSSSIWDDDGSGWEEFPEVKKVCKPVRADDGVFWLSKDEMFSYFTTIYLCAMDMKDFVGPRSGAAEKA